jgi:hypothetical protein
LNKIGEGACKEIGSVQFNELRYEGHDASPPSVATYQGTQSTVVFEESEEEPSCIFLRIDLKEIIGEVSQEELRTEEILELGVVIHEHPIQTFAAAPPVDVCICKGFAVAEILPYLFFSF